jgi:hypothetical protein
VQSATAYLQALLVLAKVPLTNRFYYTSTKETWPWPVRFKFVPNGSCNSVYEYSPENLVCGTWSIELQTVHHLAVSELSYHLNPASHIEIIDISGRKTRFQGYRLLRLKDINRRRLPKDAPCWATYLTYQTLNCQINICGLTVKIRLTNRRFLMEQGSCHADL